MNTHSSNLPAQQLQVIENEVSQTVHEASTSGVQSNLGLRQSTNDDTYRK